MAAVYRFVCCVAIWILTLSIASAHIPMHYWDWAEPDSPIYEIDAQTTSITKQQALDRLNSLRAIMRSEGVDAYVVPTADAHNSQYIAPCDARREWISGFTGSAGTVVVTDTDALVWTDARYFAQFYMEVNTTHWDLMRQGIDLAIPAWLTENLQPNSVVVVDPTTYTRISWTALETELARINVSLVANYDNLVDRARLEFGDPAPERPNEDLIPLSMEYTGKSASDKINELLSQIYSRGAVALILTALDDVAYTLNIRGSDIPYNPVFFAFLIIRSDMPSGSNLYLFWGDGTPPKEEVFSQLQAEGVNLIFNPYNEIYDYLTNSLNSTYLPPIPDSSTVWLSQDASHAMHLAVENNGARSILSTVSPVALMKCVKNEIELQGFRSAHIKDGIAVVRSLRWVHEQVNNGVEVTEIDVSDKLIEFRGQETDFMGPSFATIAGAGENGAIIHYHPTSQTNRIISSDDMLLVDSGAQYKDGTTDITRTRHMSSNPTEEQRNAFTRVMKGNIFLGTAVFPRGITGNVLETLARKALWDVGLNYAHGTGHGVGHFLNVHEGPSGILSVLLATDPGIAPGMIFSDEPGYYEDGEYGIRHEDIVEVIEMNRNSDHIMADGLVGDFNGIGALGFYTISLAPHQTACLDVDILNDFEIKYINDYHARVLSTLGPILLDRNLTEDYEWLVNECAPIQRSAAILLKSAPILTVVTVFSLWFSA